MEENSKSLFFLYTAESRAVCPKIPFENHNNTSQHNTLLYTTVMSHHRTIGS